jgi:protease I
MPSSKLNGRTVAILATDGFEQYELAEPTRLLEEAGAQTTVIAPAGAVSITGWRKNDWGRSVTVNCDLKDARVEDFDALLLPGGVMNSDTLRMNKDAVNLVRAFDDAGKPVAAICHGPWLLINAELVRNRKVTSWPSLRRDLENAGAHWQDSDVVRDGQLITSRKPDDIPAFTAALIDALGATI